jgi:hypothetical protein
MRSLPPPLPPLLSVQGISVREALPNPFRPATLVPPRPMAVGTCRILRQPPFAREPMWGTRRSRLRRAIWTGAAVHTGRSKPLRAGTADFVPRADQAVRPGSAEVDPGCSENADEASKIVTFESATRPTCNVNLHCKIAVARELTLRALAFLHSQDPMYGPAAVPGIGASLVRLIVFR